MRAATIWRTGLSLAWLLAVVTRAGVAEDPPKAFIDGTGPGWKTLGEADFTRANGDADSWVWKGADVHGTGLPVGVLRSKKQYTNFEMVARWRHLKSGGNSGFFVWTPAKALEGLKPGNLPDAGIEVQVLDHGYTEQFEKETGQKADWFTTHGDVFPVGSSKMKPFPAALAQWLAEFPLQAAEQGAERVEPLLCSGHQRRDPALGQR